MEKINQREIADYLGWKQIYLSNLKKDASDKTDKFWYKGNKYLFDLIVEGYQNQKRPIKEDIRLNTFCQANRIPPLAYGLICRTKYDFDEILATNESMASVYKRQEDYNKFGNFRSK